MPLRLLDIVVVVAALSLLIFNRIGAYHAKCKAVGNVKIISHPFGVLQFPSVLLPTSSWNTGLLFTWWNRDTLYDGVESRTLAVVPFLFGLPYIYTGSLDGLKQITAPRAPYDRPLFMGIVENIPTDTYNVLTGQRELWARHRRIVSPAFNPDVFRTVWTQSLRTFEEMMTAEGWRTLSTVPIRNVQELTAKFTLAIIAIVGFGFELPWEEVKTEGGELDMRGAFRIVSDDVLLKSMVPEWAVRLPIAKLRNMKAAYNKLFQSVKAQITDRHLGVRPTTVVEGKGLDIFSLLLKANESEDKGKNLDDNELISNTFVLLFAGHETSSKALASTLGLLACNPEEQEKLYREICDVLGDRLPVFEDYDSLKPVLCCILETLRIFPIGPLQIREVMETTALKLPGMPGPTVVEKGVYIAGDIIGINYDPTRYASPHSFLPSRWSGDLSTEDYISFGVGERTCLGRKFALYEMVCFITMFVRTWKVVPDGEGKEDREAWRKKWLEGGMKLGITMGPEEVPLRLERR